MFSGQALKHHATPRETHCPFVAVLRYDKKIAAGLFWTGGACIILASSVRGMHLYSLFT